MDYYLPNRKKKRYKTKFVSNINVTPLVDVMLVLLIIFMITAPIINNGADIQLPKTNLNNINNPHEVINITIGSSGSITINDTSSSYQNMISDLNSFNKNKKMQININGDYRADYGTIAKIIVKLNTAGFSNIALITEPE